MEKIFVDLEFCYGIKKLAADFDFARGNAFAIYAPNGVMKSSFTKTFEDIAKGEHSKDRMFKDRATRRVITDENRDELTAESVLAVQPYDAVLGHTEKTSTLLVNSALRKEYEQLHIDLEAKKESLVIALKEQSGSKKDISKEISFAITRSDDRFYIALDRIFNELTAEVAAPFAEVDYDVLFDEKVQEFLGKKDFKTAIEEYIKKYNELLAASTYFKKGVFNYLNATTIAKNLADNGFFKANHSIRLNADETIEISDAAALETLIEEEKKGISEDEDLRTKYGEIEKLLAKNASIRKFSTYLSDNEGILPFLADIEVFKENVWKSYLFKHIELYKEVVGKYRKAEQRRGEIEIEAGKERTQWEDVIEIFNSRFFVPFTLNAINRTSVILGQEPVLSLGFIFNDGAESTEVDKNALMAVLSTGEKKALYILNIIFEIEVRRKTAQETVLVVDDLADSFDYKNKYAIIQYLQEIADDQNFKLIILTHNFDFFRTVHSRFVGYRNCLMAAKSNDEIHLKQAAGINNVLLMTGNQTLRRTQKRG